MPRNPNKRRCACDGCRSWAMHTGMFCSSHGGHTRGPARLPPEIEAAPTPRPEELEVPTLESEIALLAGRRNKVDEMLRERFKQADWDPREVLRYLAVLSQVGRSLATMLGKREARSGAADLERFFEAVSERVRQLVPGDETASPE